MSTTEVPWFNPGTMDDETLLALAIGRDQLISQLHGDIYRRLESGAPGFHWLLTGPRGAGKSFFLKYAQVLTSRRLPSNTVRWINLPQEQRNIGQPADLLSEIERLVAPETGKSRTIAQWRAGDVAIEWAKALQSLLGKFKEPLLIVGIENFQELAKRFFSDDVQASLLRQLMEHEPRIMLVATALEGSHDQDYSKPFFRQFQHYSITPWNGEDHRSYLKARAQIAGIKVTDQQLNRIDAFSRYTGGLARVAAILAAAILKHEQLPQACEDFNEVLDKLTDYYIEQIERMPPKTAHLFDALVSGGEPASQTEIARRVGARQNDISRAFEWLVDWRYVVEERPPGMKEKLYRVADRLYVQWYRMRHDTEAKRPRLAVMAELLSDALSYKEKYLLARGYSETDELDNAELLLELAFKSRGISFDAGVSKKTSLGKRLVLAQRVVDADEKPRSRNRILDYLDYLETYANDKDLRQELASAFRLASSIKERYPGFVSRAELAQLAKDSLSLAPVEKLKVFLALSKEDFSQFQWESLHEVFTGEVAEFEKLKPTEGEIIKGLQVRSKHGWRYPWQVSWEELSRVVEMDPALADYQASELERQAMKAAAAVCVAAVFDDTEKLSQLLSPIDAILSAGYGHLGERLVALALRVFSRSTPTNQALRYKRSLYEVAFRIRSDLSTPERALSFLAKARAVPLETSESQRSWYDGQEAWHLGEQGKWEAALKLHLDIFNRGVSQKEWHLGQWARYALREREIYVVLSDWQEKAAPLTAEQRSHSFSQLGDAVADRQKLEGEAAAYRLARALIEFIWSGQSNFPSMKATRALFICMLDMGVSNSILHDVAGDLGVDVVDKNDAEELKQLGSLLQVLLAHLSLREADRSPALSRLEPDVKTTISAILSELTAAGKIRLGLKAEPFHLEVQRVLDRLVEITERYLDSPSAAKAASSPAIR